LLADWANGQFEVIHEWKDDKGMDAAWGMVESMYNGGRDEIYVALVKLGYNRGYFVIHTPGKFRIPVAFWHGYYSFDEAYQLVKKKCRAIGTRMGYRDPEVTT
jgi:hypothetical protein